MIKKSEILQTKIIVGLMRIKNLTYLQAEELVLGSLQLGLNFFDLADIYGGGKCEEMLGEILSQHQKLREKVIIQSKCGIKKGSYDFSYEHIIQSVNASLKRLKTTYLDVLLLHRPDCLMIPSEVNRAFKELKRQKKVRFFGVSNHNPLQIDLLKTKVKLPLLFNQLQFSVAFTLLVDSGLNVNNNNEMAISKDGHIYEYCRIHRIIMQAWSPFQYGFFAGVYLDSPKYPQLNETLNKIADKYQVDKITIASAFILRLPDKMQIVTGTTKLSRLSSIAKAQDIVLSHDEWYEIYSSVPNNLP
ncbi:MAG: aldo/keto reductase [Acholeplasmatales bacterium]|jgi:predicted oxidoreductase|nr:aldo/keto reductase [Acholeplasmatales bacterium]